MRLTLETNENIVPSQSLEGKTGHIAKIIGVQAVDGAGNSSSEFPESASHVRVKVSRRGGEGYSVQKLTGDEYIGRLLTPYNVRSSEDLLGKPVISVYDNMERVTGLIPVVMDKSNC